MKKVIIAILATISLICYGQEEKHVALPEQPHTTILNIQNRAMHIKAASSIAGEKFELIDSAIAVVWNKDLPHRFTSEKIEYNYSKDLMTISSTTYLRDTITLQWEEDWMKQETFTAGGDLQKSYIYTWNDSWKDWEGIDGGENTLNSDGYIESAKSYRWNSISNKWEHNGETVYTFDENGHYKDLVFSMLDYTGQWKYNSKCEFTCDSVGNITGRLDYFRNRDNTAWELTGKNEYHRDSMGNITLEAHMFKSGGNWVIFSQYEYTYDDKGNETLYVYSSRQVASDSLEVNTTKTYTNYYSMHEQVIEQGSSGQITHTSPVELYPNPAANSIRVNATETNQIVTLHLYDLQGKKVQEVTVIDQQTIDISHLQKGLYIYMLQTGENTFSGKLLKE